MKYPRIIIVDAAFSAIEALTRAKAEGDIARHYRRIERDAARLRRRLASRRRELRPIPSIILETTPNRAFAWRYPIEAAAEIVYEKKREKKRQIMAAMADLFKETNYSLSQLSEIFGIGRTTASRYRKEVLAAA